MPDLGFGSDLLFSRGYKVASHRRMPPVAPVKPHQRTERIPPQGIYGGEVAPLSHTTEVQPVLEPS